MITKSYYKLIRVSYADSDYFRVTNVDTTAGTLTIAAGGNLGCNIEYSTDGVNFTTADPNAPFSLVVPAGTNVYMRGTNSTLNEKTINMDANHTVGGNILSIISKDNYSSMTVMDGNRIFNGLFANNTHLTNATDLNFGNATSATGSNGALQRMFQGCSNLIYPPQTIPFETNSTSSFASQMFENCSSMLITPVIMTKNLGDWDLWKAFNGCSSLKIMTILAEGDNISFQDFHNGVPATGTFYKSSNATWTTGSGGIPSGWTTQDY